MIEASHAIRRTVSGASRSPVSVVPAPVRPFRSVVHRHHHRRLRRGRRAPAGGGGAAADLDQGVGAALITGAQIRAMLGRGLRRGQRPQDRLEDGLAFGVQPQPVLGHPVVGVRLGQGPAVPELVLPPLELAQPPVPGDDPGAKRPDLRGPSDSAIATNPASTVSAHAGVSRGNSLSISPSATAALLTGTRAARTASASSSFLGCATASATFTSAAAPPAR